MLITGVTGFIGKSCYTYFVDKYNVFAPTHQELDILDLAKLRHYIEKNKIECIVNSANLLGRRYDPSNPSRAYHSLWMFENMICASQSCKYFIHFGSGAELGNYQAEDIHLAQEEDLPNIVTPEYGGFIKAVMTRRILGIASPFYINLRVAGCFGKYEKDDRFIKYNLQQVLKNTQIGRAHV